MNSSEEQQWTVVLKPQSSWFELNWTDLWRYRDLILLLVKRDFVAIYKQTVLGPLWFLLQPVASTAVFTLIFSTVVKIPTDGAPPVLFYLAGIITWNYFAACLTRTSHTFTSNANIFGKVYFPRLAVPISIVITSSITFFIQFCLFLGFLIFFYWTRAGVIAPNKWMLFTPFLLLQMGCLGLGLGILVSSLTTKYRDLAFVVTFAMQLWMYLTPVVYPLSQVPEQWRRIYKLNPIAMVVETFRYAYLGTGTIELWYLGTSMLMTLLLLLLGIIVFSRVEKTFIDTV